MDSPNWWPYTQLAQSREKLGDTEGAAEAWRQALVAEPPVGIGLFDLATTDLARRGRGHRDAGKGRALLVHDSTAKSPGRPRVRRWT